MTDWDKHVASLPDPAKDKMPPRVAELSPEALRTIRKDKKSRSRRDWSGAAERIVARILESPRCFGAKAVNKKDDRLQEIVDKQGKTRRFYANWTHPDYSFGAIDTDGELKTGYCEVKSAAPSSSGINPFLRNTQGQIRFMDKLDDSYMKLWAFVFWEDVGKAKVFILTHDKFLNILQVGLPIKAAQDKRFKGRSIRKNKDFDLLQGCEIIKAGGRWVLEPGHWYAR